MFALKKTLPVPALRVRLLRSAVVARPVPSSLLMGESAVKVMSPAPALPVSSVTCVCNLTEPLRRMLSSVVETVSRLAAVPPLKRMPTLPVVPMTFVVVPMSIAPSVLIVVTKLVRVAVLRVSLWPKVTPASASVIVNAPML